MTADYAGLVDQAFLNLSALYDETDREEGLSPEAMDYAALWIEAKYVQASSTARTFTIELATDKLTYIEGKEVTIELP